MKLSPRKDAFRLTLGERGEMRVWDFLRRRGYKILEKNHRSRYGEIDIIAEHAGRIIFIEVKTRRNDEKGTPEEAVTAAKQRKIARLAAAWLQEKKQGERPVSFEVAAVDWRGGEADIRIFENAFEAEAEIWQA